MIEAMKELLKKDIIYMFSFIFIFFYLPHLADDMVLIRQFDNPVIVIMALMRLIILFLAMISAAMKIDSLKK